MCGRRMKLELIWPHLDQCEKDQNHQEKPPSAKPAVSVTSSFNSSAQSNLFNAQSRLPQLNYSLYKENSLRKKLSELGIRTTGPKQLLERRHTEWVNLWNANCDANRPRSKKDLLRELEVWERTQGTPTPGSHFGAGMGGGPSGVGGAAGSAVMRKDFDGAVWSATHDASFKDLIVKARRKKGEGDAKQEELESNQGPITSTPERAALNGQTASEVFMIDSSDTEPVSHGRPDLNDNVWSSPVHPLAQSQTSAEKPVHDDLGQDPIVDEANET
ncbi:MAG: hypothetical protein M4579_004018 [Chaenotheca gracillima]|nr:MAG: hypothetical protein M4579_004018 [Chaenotheca gracillima]